MDFRPRKTGGADPTEVARLALAETPARREVAINPAVLRYPARHA